MTSDDSDRTPDQNPDQSSAPKPRSAASRARRIGGAGVTPRPAPHGTSPDAADQPTAANAEPTVDTTKKQSAASPAQVPGGAPGTRDTPDAADSADSADTDSRAGIRVSLPGWAVWSPAVALSAVAVVFLVLFLVARFGNGDDTGQDTKTREAVLAAAKTCLATLNTYRYDQLASAEAAGAKCTTGQLTSDYKRTVTNIISKNAPSLQAIQQAKITTAGIESVTGNGKQWTVLAYGTLSITTKAQKQGRQDPFAVVARLQQVGNSWVLSKIDTVSSFTS